MIVTGFLTLERGDGWRATPKVKDMMEVHSEYYIVQNLIANSALGYLKHGKAPNCLFFSWGKSNSCSGDALCKPRPGQGDHPGIQDTALPPPR